MLNLGERVLLGNEEYEVEKIPKELEAVMINCDACDLKNCTLNKYLDEVKAKHFNQNCATLLPRGGYFKLVAKTRRSCKTLKES